MRPLLLGLFKEKALRNGGPTGSMDREPPPVVISGVAPIAAEEPGLRLLCASVPAAAERVCFELGATTPRSATPLQRALALWLAVPVRSRFLVPAADDEPKLLQEKGALRIPVCLPGAGWRTIEIAPNGDVAIGRRDAEALDVALPTAVERERLQYVLTSHRPRRLPRPFSLGQLEEVANHRAPWGRLVDPDPEAILNRVSVRLGAESLATELRDRELTDGDRLDDQPAELLAGLLVCHGVTRGSDPDEEHHGRLDHVLPMPRSPWLRVRGQLEGKGMHTRWNVVAVPDGRFFLALHTPAASSSHELRMN